MSYIVVVEVDLSDEDNHRGNVDDVKVRTLAKDGDVIKFDAPAQHNTAVEVTKEIVNAVLDAGFVAFEVHHSW